MIVPLLEETEQTLATYNEFLRSRQQAEQINATLRSLRDTQRTISSFARHYQLLNPILSDRLPINFSERITLLQSKIGESQSALSTKPQQVRELTTIENEAKRLDRVLLEAWGSYAQELIRPKQDLYELLAELPEVRGNEMKIKSRMSELRGQTQSLPQNAIQLRTFHEQLQEITDILTTVQGITPVIQNFLKQVHQKTFTLADLNDEILTWCRINNCAHTFKIIVT
jgi:hypothetical protein